MMSFLLIIGGIIFLFGLVQWARSGVILWDLHEFLKRDLLLGVSTDEKTTEKKKSMQRIIRKMETKIDGLLKSSFNLVAVLALCVWLFVIAFVTMDMLGIDWSNRTSRSNQVLGSPTARAGLNNASTARSATVVNQHDAIFAMGSNLRR